MVANIFEDFEPPSKTFLAKPTCKVTLQVNECLLRDRWIQNLVKDQSKIEIKELWKIIKAFNYFGKTLHLESWEGSARV